MTFRPISTKSVTNAVELKIYYDYQNNTTLTVSNTGDITIDSSGNDINMHSTDAVHVLNTTASTSTTTGALIASGGIGVAGKVYADHFVQGGANTYWEDLQMIGMARTGGGTNPTYADYNSTGVYGWSFSSSATNQLTADAQLPHSCSGLIIPHIHISGNWNGSNNSSV
jgi:hypothetical protein